MSDAVRFDHIEIHVADIPRYGEFLKRLFRGGRFKQISDSGTSMFVTDSDECFEIKERTGAGPVSSAGFCLPCIRMSGALSHIQELGLHVDRHIQNPEGDVYFFTDHEGVQWHAKNYEHRDRYVNW